MSRHTLITRINDRFADDARLGVAHDPLLVDCRAALLQHKSLKNEVERLRSLARQIHKASLKALRIDS